MIQLHCIWNGSVQLAQNGFDSSSRDHGPIKKLNNVEVDMPKSNIAKTWAPSIFE